MSPASIPITNSTGVTSNTSTPASSPGHSSGRFIYSREELLSLASSPLSQTPPDSAAFNGFPASILRTTGNALSTAAAPQSQEDSDTEEVPNGMSTSQQFDLELE